MAFNLHVTFSGPCLYVLDTDGEGVTRQVGVLIPDCRLPSSGPPPKHLDSSPAEPHVGYVRLDMAHINRAIPSGAQPDEPRYELVHRFTRQVLTFEGLSPEPMNLAGLKYPDFDQFARTPNFLDPKDGLFAAPPDQPPAELLMRTILRGGDFVPDPDPTSFWEFTTVLRPGGPPYVGEFASSVTWKRQVGGTTLTLKVTNFGMTLPEAQFTLGPFAENETVALVVRNLCSVNPLDWGALPIRRVTAIDEDFKWLYRLLRTRGATTVDLPMNARLPAPVLVRTSGTETGEEACMGGKITRAIPG